MKSSAIATTLCLLILPVAGSAAGFEDEIVRSHNAYRAKHSAPALRWNASVAAVAQEWADTNARENKMYHRPNNKYGENIYWMSGGKVSGTMAVDAWYNEVGKYNFAKPGFSMQTGHFTQVVWKGRPRSAAARPATPRAAPTSSATTTRPATTRAASRRT